MAKRRVQFQADDFGYNNRVNQVVTQLYKKKKIEFFSVLSDFLPKVDNNEMKRFLKDKKVALHVNLVEGERYSPLPFFFLKLLLGLIDFKNIESDIQRQIDILKRYQVKIVELNSHQHTHALYPISDIFASLAKKNNIPKVRSYQNASVQTFRAKICLLILKTASFLSFYRYKIKIGMPHSWNNTGSDIYFMSWEDKGFSIDELPKKKPAEIVIHPGTNFDKNNNFSKYL